MNMFSEIISRLEFGYPIGDGFRLFSKTHDNLLLNYGALSYELFIETLVDNSIVIYATKSRILLNEKGETVDEKIFETGLSLIVRHFEKLGKKLQVK
jgi:hypothetical protein